MCTCSLLTKSQCFLKQAWLYQIPGRKTNLGWVLCCLIQGSHIVHTWGRGVLFACSVSRRVSVGMALPGVEDVVDTRKLGCISQLSTNPVLAAFAGRCVSSWPIPGVHRVSNQCWVQLMSPTAESLQNVGSAEIFLYFIFSNSRWDETWATSFYYIASSVY